MRYGDLEILRFDFISLYCLIYKIAQDMNGGNTVFSQLMSLIPDYELRKCIDRYIGDFHTRRFTCREQFLVMSYAQFTSSTSLRSIEARLTAFNSQWYHAEMDKGFGAFDRLFRQNLNIPSNVIGQILFDRTPLNELFAKPIINKNPEDDRLLSFCYNLLDTCEFNQ